MKIVRHGSSPLARGTPAQAGKGHVDFRFIPAGAGNTVYGESLGLIGTGSSPLARGTRPHVDRKPDRGRFIPAGAGNTITRVIDNFPCSVHPRWRGEHGHPVPPRARQPRFIPAGAGNTTSGRRTGRHRSVHPRWRGEHQGSQALGPGNSGSSPLARGTRRPAPSRRRHHRFIPAGAGNTRPGRAILQSWTVHPRWRGEHLSSSCLVKAATGSSPLARGTLPALLNEADRLRFIPAGAGNT